MKKANGRPQVIAGGIPNPGGRHLLVIRALKEVEIGKVNENSAGSILQIEPNC